MVSRDEPSFINASDLLSGVSLVFSTKQLDESADLTLEPSQASPLRMVAKDLKASFKQSSWALAEGTAAAGGVGGEGPTAAGVPPEIYTTALRAALIEYGGNPVATLPDRLRAADSLAAFLGMSGGAHETLMLRALAANESLVYELQAQASALRHHRCGLTVKDFNSKTAYRTWRMRALRAARAALLCLQRMPEYNALLEVALIGARDLAIEKEKSFFSCCFSPADLPLCPYAWAHLVVPPGAEGALAVLGTRTQHTQVLNNSGPNPSWHAMLQPLSLTSEQSELRFKVSQCSDSRGTPRSHDLILGVSGIRVEGLQAGVTQQVVLPLFTVPQHLRVSGAATTNPQETEHNLFYRVVYDPVRDELLGGSDGGRDVWQQGSIVLQLRYILERRTRYDVPSENVFCADLSDEEDDDSSLQSQTTRSTDKSVPNGPNSKIGRNSRPNNAAANGGSDDAQWTGIGRGARGGPGAAVGQNVQRAVDTVVTGAQNAVGTVVTGAQTAVDTMIFGAKATADYMQYLTQALAQGLVESPLIAGLGLRSRVKSVQINAAREPVNIPRNASISKVDTARIIKQLAGVLATAARSGRSNQAAQNALAALPKMPPFPVELRTLMLSPSMRANRSSNNQGSQGNQMQGQGQQGRVSVNRSNSMAKDSNFEQIQQQQAATALQETWGILEDRLVAPYLPLGPSIGVLIRASMLLAVRAETLLILIVQLMIGDWPLYISSTIKGRTPGQGQSSDFVGGAQDYLYALRVVWGKVLTWHVAGTLTKDETEGVKGIMGLLLGRVLPALEQHYSVFVGNEGAECFVALLEMIGWAWTWDPKAPIPYNLLTDYLKDTATQSMNVEFRPSASTLTQDVESLVKEVEMATQCLKRDKHIQTAMPGLRAFSTGNARERYQLLVDHLDALMLYHPGANAEAMEHLFDLEAALTEHHKLLIDMGHALPLDPPPVPKELLPRTATGELIPLPDRPTAQTSENGGERTSGNRSMRRSGPQSTSANGRPVAMLHLYDVEASMIDQLDKFIRVDAAELMGQVTRLLAATKWDAVSETSFVSESHIQLNRLIQAKLESWLHHVCAGSDARRLRLGVLVTAITTHILHHYISSVTAVWDKELDDRSSVFTGVKTLTPAGPTINTVESVATSHPAQSAASFWSRAPDMTGPSFSQTIAPFMPGLSAASAPVLPRVASMAVGLPDVNDGLSFTSLGNMSGGGALPPPTVPPAKGHHHKRSQSQSTAFASNLEGAGQYRDVAALRQAIKTAFRDTRGLCLTERMCVIRATLYAVDQTVREAGELLVQTLIEPALPLKGGQRNSSNRNSANQRPRGRADTSSDSDRDGSPVRTDRSSDFSQSSVRHSHSRSVSNPRARMSYGRSGDGDGEEPDPWTRRPGRMVRPDSSGHLDARASGGRRLSTGGGERTSLGTLGADNKPIINFVGTHWQELERRTHAVESSLLANYSVTLRSVILAILVASCGLKRDDPVDETMLGEGLLPALDDELRLIGEKLGRMGVLVAEMGGGVWRAFASSLQLLALNQAGFRPLSEMECELLKDLLHTFQGHWKEMVTVLSERGGVRLDYEYVSDPRYPRELMRQMRDSAPRASRTLTLSRAHGAQPSALSDVVRPELQASLVLPPCHTLEDHVSRRLRSGDYCAALLQSAHAAADTLKQLFEVQESCMFSIPTDGGVYVPLGPQQLPMLDLLRLMRLRRKYEPTSAQWADDMVRNSSAVIPQVLFGLAGSERVVAEVKCVLAGANKSQGRMYITPGALCFTTMIDGDSKGTSDTTLSILRSKIVSVVAGVEAGSLVVTTTDHDFLSFTTFTPSSDRARVISLLTSPPPPTTAPTTAHHKPSASAAPAFNSPPQNRTFGSSDGVARVGGGAAVAAGGAAAAGAAAAASKATAGTGYANGSGGTALRTMQPAQPRAQPQQQPQLRTMQGAANAAAAAATAAPSNRSFSSTSSGVSTTNRTFASTQPAYGGGAAGGAGGAGAVAGGVAGGARREPSRDPWARREPSADPWARREAEQRARVSSLTSSPAQQAAPAAAAAAAAASGTARTASASSSTSGANTAANRPQPTAAAAQPAATAAAPPAAPSPPPAAAAAAVSSAPAVMSVPCSLYGSLMNTDGTLSLFDDRVEFAGADGALVHRVMFTQLVSVGQTTGILGDTRLLIKVDPDVLPGGVTQLQFASLSPTMITSLKDSIISRIQ